MASTRLLFFLLVGILLLTAMLLKHREWRPLGVSVLLLLLLVPALLFGFTLVDSWKQMGPSDQGDLVVHTVAHAEAPALPPLTIEVAKPTIVLDEEAPESAASPKEPTEPLPEWVTTLTEGDTRQVLSTDPRTTIAEADAEANRLLLEAVKQVLVEKIGLPESALDGVALPVADMAHRFSHDAFLETRKTSVGTMHISHRLVDFDEEGVAWLIEMWGEPLNQKERRGAALVLSAIGGAMLVGLALTNVVLSLGGRSSG